MSTLVPELVQPPAPAAFDALVVLGGPMSAWQVDKYPWLQAEKHLIAGAIEAGKPVLGICLGAQLVAEVLGARTYAGPQPEIGWHRVQATAASRHHPVGSVLPEAFETFLWHGDTFDIPEGAVRLARSTAFENQGFVWNRVLALQFHLEVRPDWVRLLARRDAEQLVAGAYTQSADQVLGKAEAVYAANNALMERLLDAWMASVGRLSSDPRS